jgi:pimeloyl-ACP methyl ester carboxylesterase
MKRGTFADLPQPYKDAYLKINPSQDALFTMHERDSRRMLQFEDIPDALIQSIQAPTFVVAGDRDVVRPEHALELSRLVPNSRLCILPGGHGEYLGEIMYPDVNEHVPRLFVALVNEFLASPRP